MHISHDTNKIAIIHGMSLHDNDYGEEKHTMTLAMPHTRAIYISRYCTFVFNIIHSVDIKLDDAEI